MLTQFSRGFPYISLANQSNKTIWIMADSTHTMKYHPCKKDLHFATLYPPLMTYNCDKRNECYTRCGNEAAGVLYVCVHPWFGWRNSLVWMDGWDLRQNTIMHMCRMIPLNMHQHTGTFARSVTILMRCVVLLETKDTPWLAKDVYRNNNNNNSY